MPRSTLRLPLTLGLAAAASAVCFLAHAETVHQGGFEHQGGVVRYKSSPTFLIGEPVQAQRARITVHTPQAPPALSLRIVTTESPTVAPATPVAAAETVAVVPQIPAVARQIPEFPRIDAPVPAPSIAREAAPAAPAVLATGERDARFEAPRKVPVVNKPPAVPAQSMEAPSPAPAVPVVNEMPRVPGEAGDAACESHTVTFQRASVWIHPKTARQLVAALSSCGAKQVVVTGYTCDLGNRTVNERMALGRAEEVAKILRKAGFEVVEVNGRGQTDYVGSNPERRNENRRVVVTTAS